MRIVAALILLLAVASRFFGLTTNPGGIHFDECNGYRPDLPAMARIDNLRDTGAPTVLLTELVDRFAPNYWLASRWTAAGLGVASIAATMALGALYGLVAAVVSGAFLLVSAWHILASRANPLVPVVFLVAPLCWLAVLSLFRSERVARACVLVLVSGACLALALRVYTPARVLPVVVLVWFVWQSLVTPGFLYRMAAPFVLVAMLVLWLSQPILDRPYDYAWRLREVTALGPKVRAEFTRRFDAAEFGQHRLAALSKFSLGGAHIWPNDPVTGPLVNVWELLLLAPGLLICAYRWRRPEYGAVLLWIGGTLVAVALTTCPECSYRAAPILPALAVAVGIGAQRITQVGWWTAPFILAALLAAYTVSATTVADYYRTHSRPDRPRAIAKAISALPRTPTYYVWWPDPATIQSPTFRCLTSRHKVEHYDGTMPAPPAVVVLPRGAQQQVDAEHMDRLYLREEWVADLARVL